MPKIDVSDETYEKIKDQLLEESAPEEPARVKLGVDVMVRTRNAGVFLGKLKQRDAQEVTLHNAVRIWYWTGACSLSQLVQQGTKNADECKFAVPVDEVILFETVEILGVTLKASRIIRGASSWQQ